jgi:hypothetical protein
MLFGRQNFRRRGGGNKFFANILFLFRRENRTQHSIRGKGQILFSSKGIGENKLVFDIFFDNANNNFVSEEQLWK